MDVRATPAISQKERQRSGDSQYCDPETAGATTFSTSVATREREGHHLMLCAGYLRNACFEGRRKERRHRVNSEDPSVNLPNGGHERKKASRPKRMKCCN